MIPCGASCRRSGRLVLPLVVAAVVNVGVYFLVVYPLTARTASVEARAQAATVSLAQALNEFRAAEATRTGRARADQQLTRFYAEILPRDQTGARRITYLRLAKLAEEANLDYARRTFTAVRERESELEQLEGAMVLDGRLPRRPPVLVHARNLARVRHHPPGRADAGRTRRTADADPSARDLLPRAGGRAAMSEARS